MQGEAELPRRSPIFAGRKRELRRGRESGSPPPELRASYARLYYGGRKGCRARPMGWVLGSRRVHGNRGAHTGRDFKLEYAGGKMLIFAPVLLMPN